jgi:hypothetical protein
VARCDFQRRKPPASPIGAMYRGVELCNTFNVSGDEFDVRNRYFRDRVDSLYSRYYSELTTRYAKHIGAALALWLALLVGWFTFKWIARGAS